MMHSFVGFLFDLITCQVKFNKKEEKVSVISYKYMYVITNSSNICFQQWSRGPLNKTFTSVAIIFRP